MTDNPRSVSRYCSDSDEHRELSAKLLCLMQTTLCGTIYVYQGEELGQKNVPLSWDPSEYLDVESQNYWQKMKEQYPHDQEKLKFARKVLQKKARDHARTPVQWSAESNAGFCPPDTKPWMRVNEDYKVVNAEAQRKFSSDEQLSVLQFWKRGLEQRKQHKASLVYGNFELLDESHPQIFAYKRTGGGESMVTVLNFSGQEFDWDIPAHAKIERWVAGNYTKAAPEKGTSGKVKLRAWEAMLGELKCPSLITLPLTVPRSGASMKLRI